MDPWVNSPGSRGGVSLVEALRALIEVALTDGSHELRRASDGNETGILRLNLSLSVRHGKPQGSSSSLVFEKKLGY